MKINKLIKAFSLLLVVVFAACADFEDTIVDSPQRPAGNQGVFFPASNASLFELEPAAATQITLKIAREVSSGAVSVPLNVVTNDDNVFNVPQSVSFADGEQEVEFTVNFPNAAEGIAYELKLSVEGDDLVNPYGENLPVLTTTVSRIKWSPVPRPLVYIDGTFATLFGVQFYPMYVEADSVKLDNSTRYRLKNAYRVPTSDDPDEDGIFDGYPYNEPGDFDDSRDWFTTLEIYNNGEVYVAASNIGVDWSYGMISIGNVVGNTAQTDKSQYPWGKLQGDVITFPSNSLYFSMAGYNNGGKYPASNPTTLYLTKEAFIAANLKIEDFNDVEYELVEGELGVFESAAFGESWDKTLSLAIDLDEENEESDYKNLFYISDLYSDGLGLAFYNIDGIIRIPAAQPTGIEFMGNEVYVSQSPTNSSSITTNYKGTTIYTFGLIFHYEDGTIVGDHSETFFYSEEALVYTKEDFLGNFTLITGSTESDVVIAEDEEGDFVITGMAYIEELIATFDATDSKMTIAAQRIANILLGDATYQATWFVNTTGGPSGSATLEFAFDLRGNLVLTDTSTGIGYRIQVVNVDDEDDFGWLTAAVNYLLFVPEIVEEPITEAVILRNTTAGTRSSGSGPNFSIQGKMDFNNSSKLVRNQSASRIN